METKELDKIKLKCKYCQNCDYILLMLFVPPKTLYRKVMQISHKITRKKEFNNLIKIKAYFKTNCIITILSK